MIWTQGGLLGSLILLVARVPFAASQTATTITVPVISHSIVPFESIVTSTVTEERVSVYTTTIRGRERITSSIISAEEVVISTHTGESTVSVTAEIVVVTTINPDSTLVIPTSLDATSIASGAAIGSGAPVASVQTTSVEETRPIQTPSNGGALSPADPEQSETDSGKSNLSVGAKVGIGVGVSFAVILLAAMLVFLRSCFRRRASSPQEDMYEARDKNPTAVSSEEQLTAMPREPGPEDMTHPAYEAANPRLSNPIHMTAATYEDKRDDAPMYLGVPTHMSGEKRWSVPDS